MSPADSHEPTTAIPQAFYNRDADIRQLITETGASQWGTSLAFAGSLFDLNVKVFQTRVSYDQKPYRRAVMETYGARCVASPLDQTKCGRSVLAGNPDDIGSLGECDLGIGGAGGEGSWHQIRPGFGPQPYTVASVHHRLGIHGADGDGGCVAWLISYSRADWHGLSAPEIRSKAEKSATKGIFWPDNVVIEPHTTEIPRSLGRRLFDQRFFR
jgi:hypothetical protein